MKKILLQQPLTKAGVLHEAGTEVELDDDTYEWLQNQYLQKRRDEVKTVAAVQKEILKFKRPE
jgi:hypothetical protein